MIKISSDIPPPHLSFATHLLEANYDIPPLPSPYEGGGVGGGGHFG
jgi:hypothetical protein